MKPPVAPRLRLLASALSILLVAALLASMWFWWQLRASLPVLNGSRPLRGLAADVKVERDVLGVPTVRASSRMDLARTLGWLHAQDRFFQMDLLRRSAAGELSEIFGKDALPYDRSARIHRFRTVAHAALEHLAANERNQLEAYAAGVNAGLAALDEKPFEYLVLRANPAPWTPEDSLLVGYAMWLDLQDSTGTYERDLAAVRDTLGIVPLAFFAPQGSSWDAALDGSTTEPVPVPPPGILNLRTRKIPAAASAPVLTGGEYVTAGSNSLAVGGAFTSHGAALLANDMHLRLGIPNIWYRASLVLSESASPPRRVTGVTLPGFPFVVAGSNGSIAWGFTTSRADTTDLVVIETDAAGPELYRTPGAWELMKIEKETIVVKGAEPEVLEVKNTIWGPIIGTTTEGRPLALHWLAHDPDATNCTLLSMADATDITAALDVAHRAGIPAQNFLVVDRQGTLAWTIAGRLPRRVGFNGRLPTSWAYGDRHWNGLLPPEDVPQIIAPANGTLWTANNRTVGGTALAKLGDGGYDIGARAHQIHDDLDALIAHPPARGGPAVQGNEGGPVRIVPQDLLNIMLDDRAIFLTRWQQVLLNTLTSATMAGHGERVELRSLVEAWGARAGVETAGYRLVKTFRSAVAARVLNPIFEPCTDAVESFSYEQLNYEDALWRLISERPIHLLSPRYQTWDDLLLAAADDTLAATHEARLTPKQFTWGEHNTAHIKHPLAQVLPGPLAGFLAMPADRLPGDGHMPRVQTPDFGASERLVVAPGHEEEGIFHMPGGQSGHPLSPFFSAGHSAWVRGEPTPFLPGPAKYTLTLTP